MRIYIAGPMRGYPEHNFPAFDRAAVALRELGHEVVSPVEVGYANFRNDPGVPGGEYVRADLRELAKCDAIALLAGWEKSTGARCEVVVALTVGMAFVAPDTALPVNAPSRVTCNGGYERAAGVADTLDGLRDEAIMWANATFVEATPSSKAEHLRREVVELCAEPGDVEEMADVFLLLAHISDGLDLVSAVRAKLEKNKARRWGVPDAHGVVEHIESDREAQHV